MTRDRTGRSRTTRVGADGRARNVWAPEERAESSLTLDEPALAESDLPETALPDDPAEHHTHDLAHLGIQTLTLPNGVLVAHNTRGPGSGIRCPVCGGDRDRAADCAECVGRGEILSIPFCDRPWDVVETTSTGGRLYLGGHDCQPGGGSTLPGSQFDLVVSLYTRPGFEPAPHIPHLTHRMVDGDLHPEDHEPVLELADAVTAATRRGEKVLVRCQAGMNRSGLVAGLALVNLGWSPDTAMDHMRRQRSPYVLFNSSFAAFVRAHRRR